MASAAYGRVKREIQECLKDTSDSGIKISPVGDSLSHLRGEIKGPEGTPYEGGIFPLDIEIPDSYPFVPPKVKFINKVWHPNISSVTGVICLDILKDNWAAAMTLRTVLLSIQALLSAPEPRDPQDAVVAKQYLSDRPAFNATAKYWTEVYASGPKDPNSAERKKVQQLVEMGFEESISRTALANAGGNLESAIEALFG
eukprot:Colp12_sorted_trinity150504_noHs@26631